MRLIIVLSIVVAAVSGAALPNSVEKRQAYNSYPNDVQILRYEVDNIGTGKYRYAYEQSDGSRQEQTGEIKNEGRENESLAVSGSFSWVAPDGVRHAIYYIADENGYQPTLHEGLGAGGAFPAGNILSSALGG